MKTFLLPEQLGNAVLQYLAQRPYAEVAALIAGLSQLQEVPPAPVVATGE
jgi:hypothetical protein